MQETINDIAYFFLRSGWGTLHIIIICMVAYVVWKDSTKTRKQKIGWTALVALLPIIGLGIWLFKDRK
ncbi:PLDc N-terminal domain-containing protein [Pontibacter sp. G13]|uniref:PLDc N-terminal domain-containing protein n=1 Tax=Pontibacter sp. G13 TaxID=3074898 RepID=UPI00288C5E5E|nr:PLDc N-terminal domain-containing protein [Pontibacter sp. G13]WNJ20614.1 PLDc N-terminal domain-containing protein [Pontibacter sp. G13]